MKNKLDKIIFLVIILVSVFFGGDIKNTLAANKLRGEACVDSIDKCEEGYFCASKSGVATSYCTLITGGVTKKEDGLSCTLPSECSGGFCEISSTGQKVCGHSASNYPTAPATTALTSPAPTSTRFNYTLLESFPGFFTGGTQMTDFPAMIIAIYKFGIWTVGIAGFFMLVVGGFMYMASAGNTSTAGSARGIIWDALLGIVAALGAYLILYVINPDLTKVTIGTSFIKVDIRESEGTPMGTAGVCQSLSTGNCSVSNLTPIFGSLATQASSICNGESGGQSIVSTVDHCQGNGLNDSVSVGLFQINLSAHNIGALNCPDAFNRIYDADTAKNKSLCWVKDRILYDQCVAAAKNPSTNIAVAKSIYDKGKSWKPWGANKRSNCNFP